MYSVFLRLGRSQKKPFSANGNKSEVVDDDEIYTLKPYFPIFIAKKAGKNEWLRTGKKKALRNAHTFDVEKVDYSPHLQWQCRFRELFR